MSSSVRLIPGAIASAIVSGFKSERAKIAAIEANNDKAIQKAIDAVKSGLTTTVTEALKASSKVDGSLRHEVDTLFKRVAEVADWSDSQRNNYKLSFFAALQAGIPYKRGLYNTHGADGQLKVAKAKADAKPQTGKVETTDRPALLATITKAIKQARLLNLDSTASGLIDLAVELEPTFKAE